MRRRFPQPSAKPSASLYEDVRPSQRPLGITKRGKPVANRVPIEEANGEFIGRLKGVFKVGGDLDADPPEKWQSAF